MKLQSTRKLFFRLLLIPFFLTNLGGSGLVGAAFAEGTRTWEQSKFEELTKGTATGVAIRSSGGLELAPAFKSLYATPSTYIWSVASDDAGNVYVATGAPADAPAEIVSPAKAAATAASVILFIRLSSLGWRSSASFSQNPHTRFRTCEPVVSSLVAPSTEISAVAYCV